jgi:hypothetical protein
MELYQYAFEAWSLGTGTFVLIIFIYRLGVHMAVPQVVYLLARKNASLSSVLRLSPVRSSVSVRLQAWCSHGDPTFTC